MKLFKIVGPDSSQNFPYSSFSTHETYKAMIQKHVNSKPKVLSNTMFRISGFWTTDIHPRKDSVNN